MQIFRPGANTIAKLLASLVAGVVFLTALFALTLAGVPARVGG